MIVLPGFSKRRRSRAKKENYLTSTVKNIYSDKRVYSPNGNILVSSFNLKSDEKKNLGYLVSSLDDSLRMPLLNAVVMPINEGLNNNFVFENKEINYTNLYKKDSENSGFGYASYKLLNSGVETHITATKNVSVFSFNFPKSKESKIQIDLSSLINSDKKVYIEFDELNGVQGWIDVKDDEKSQKKYFFAEFSRYYESWGVWEKTITKKKKEVDIEKIFYEDTLSFTGINSGFYINYSTRDNDAITMKLAFSNNSISDAKKVIKRESPDWDFYAVADEVENIWESYFDSFTIVGDNNMMNKFYKNLYDSMIFTLHNKSFIFEKQDKDISFKNHKEVVLSNILSNSKPLDKLFEMAGLRPTDSSFSSFEIVKPKFQEVDFKIEDSSFVLKTNIDSIAQKLNAGGKLDMVQASLNNKELNENTISIEDIYNGGVLDLKFEIK